MNTILVSLTYLIATGIRMYQYGSEQVLIHAVLFPLLTVSITVITWSGFLLRSEPGDWSTAHDRLQRPLGSLSPLDGKEAMDTLVQLRHCLYTAGVVVSIVFWKILCEETNPFGLVSERELSLVIPAIAPLIPLLLLDDRLNRMILRLEPDSREISTGFWHTSLLLFIVFMSILGNMRYGPGDTELDIFFIVTAFCPPLLILLSRSLYQKLFERSP